MPVLDSGSEQQHPQPLEGFVPWPDAVARTYRAAGWWAGDTLPGLLRAWASQWAGRTAVVAGEWSCTYAELAVQADLLAAGFSGLGIEPGDRVLVQLPNGAAFVPTLFGLLGCGAVPVLTLPAHRRSEIVHLGRLSGATALVIPAVHNGFDHRDLAAQASGQWPELRHVLVAGDDPGPFTALSEVAAAGAGASPPEPPIRPEDVALLLVSGGTTGLPKLICRTHDDYAYNARASAEVCGLTAGDVYLVSLPIAHNFPLACPGVLGTLGVGGTVVVATTPSPDEVFGLIERHRVTVTAVVPPIAALWAELAEWDERDRSSLRILQVGGARLSEDLAGRLPGALGCAVQQVYGMAEGLLNYTRLDDRPELVRTTQGRPLSAGDELRIVDPDDPLDADVPRGAVGELLTRGPYTHRGYYRGGQDNLTGFTPDGYFRTGDLVRRTGGGHLVVEGRVKDCINRGGETIATGELEEHLTAHPGVREVAVVPVPDPVFGERVGAVIVAEGEPPDRRELVAFLTGRGLAAYKLPDTVVVRPALPRTGVGKIDKRALLADLEAAAR